MGEALLAAQSFENHLKIVPPRSRWPPLVLMMSLLLPPENLFLCHSEAYTPKWFSKCEHFLPLTCPLPPPPPQPRTQVCTFTGLYSVHEGFTKRDFSWGLFAVTRHKMMAECRLGREPSCAAQRLAEDSCWAASVCWSRSYS